MNERLLTCVNTVRENKGLAPMETLDRNMNLRTDVGLDSLDLAELTVRIENEFGIDVFEDSLVATIGEILDKLES